MSAFRKFCLFSLFAMMWAAVSAAAHAEDASQWSGPEQGQMRLVSGGALNDGKLYAGLEVKLDKGWKTYWRSPGDSGIPPFFDWTGSENVSDVQVRWPAPKRFRDDFGLSIGYKKDVVFPLQITPKDRNEPVSLKLKAQYGVCSNICIPATAELALNLQNNASGKYLPQIKKSLARVPSQSLDGVKIKGASVKTKGKDVMLNVAVQADDSVPLEVFVEGPQKFYFETPQAQGNSMLYTLRVDGAKAPEDLKGAELTVTIVQGKRSLERNIVVD